MPVWPLAQTAASPPLAWPPGRARVAARSTRGRGDSVRRPKRARCGRSGSLASAAAEHAIRAEGVHQSRQGKPRLTVGRRGPLVAHWGFGCFRSVVWAPRSRPAKPAFLSMAAQDGNARICRRSPALAAAAVLYWFADWQLPEILNGHADWDDIRNDEPGAARSDRYTLLVIEPGVSKTSSPSGSRTVARVIVARGVD
jgi:hypothetical protein